MNGDQQELIEGAAKKQKRAHAREYVLEAVCFVSEVDVKRLTRFDGEVRAAAKDLRRIKGVPNDTVGYAEVVRRAQVYRKMRAEIERKQSHQVKITAAGLVKNWGRCKGEASKTIQPGQPSRKEQAAMKHEFKEWEERTLAWWNALPKRERLERSKRYPHGISVSQIAWGEYQRRVRSGYQGM